MRRPFNNPVSLETYYYYMNRRQSSDDDGAKHARSVYSSGYQHYSGICHYDYREDLRFSQRKTPTGNNDYYGKVKSDVKNKMKSVS